MSEDIQERVHSAIRYLAGVCDYAESQDGQGFNSIDTWVGHTLAAQNHLSLAEFKFAVSMLRKYRKQLESAGISLPSDEEVTAHIGEHKVEDYTRSQLRQKKYEEKRAEREAEYQRRLAEAKKANPDRVSFQHGRIIVQFGYDPAKVAAIHPLKKTVKDWAFNRYGSKEWSFPKSAVEQVLEALKPFDDFEYDPKIDEARREALAEAELQRQLAELEQQAREAEKRAAQQAIQPYLEGAPLEDGRTLFAHQREAIAWMIARQYHGAILAHDRGLGKTISALIAAKAYGLRTIVIAPVSVMISWMREAEAVGVSIEVYSWAYQKIPAPPEEDYVLICDEAQRLQNLKSRRTQAVLDLAAKARAFFPLSGTPMNNGQPINLFPLLKMCEHPLGQSKSAYEKRYCNAHVEYIRGREIWDNSGASNLDELHKKTRDVILYRKKEDCLDLPEKMVIPVRAEVSAEAEKAYHALIAQLKAEHKQRTEEKMAAYKEKVQEYRQLLAIGMDPDELEEPEEYDPEAAEALVAFGQLMQAGSQAKIESALSIADEVLQQGGSIVLFTMFRLSAEALAAKLNCPILLGGMKATERQEIIDKFQSKQVRALVCTFGAGAEGITLTAAQTMVLVDRAWTPGGNAQAMDRIHRIGQTGTVTIYWLQYGEVDERVDQLLSDKQERIDLVMEGKRKTMRGVRQSVQALAKQVVHEMLQ